MKRETFSILFYIKRTKLLKDGNAPIYLKITVNGKSSETSIKRSINPKNWDTKKNRAKSNSASADTINHYLNSVQSRIYNHHQAIKEKDQVFDSKNLMMAFLGRKKNDRTLIQLYNEIISDMQKLVGKGYSKLTVERHSTALKHISSFLEYQFNSKDMNFQAIDHSFFQKFENYLKGEKDCGHNTTMKHMSSLRKIILQAVSRDIINKNPMMTYKITTKPVVRECLTDNEIQRLAEKKFAIKRLEVIRDLFLFQCFTGLAFIDLKNLSSNSLVYDMHGNDWIFIQRGKTDTPCHIPLLPIAKGIIEKYSDHPCRSEGLLFPVPTNQKMNAYLKEIADLCLINKNIHTHLARHTYATTVTLSKGIPMETVSKVLGHTKLQTTQIYARLNDKKISEDFSNIDILYKVS